MLSSFFKQNKHKRYNYTPRYYDERRERLDDIKKKYGVIEDESGEKGAYRRKSFRDDWTQNSKTQNNKNSKIRLFIILIISCLCFFKLFRY